MIKQGMKYILIGLCFTFGISSAADKSSVTQVISETSAIRSSLSAASNLAQLTREPVQPAPDSCELSSEIRPDGSIAWYCVQADSEAAIHWDITSWTPENIGLAGNVMNINGFNMPELEFKLNGQPLEILAATSSLKIIQLPDEETSGSLTVARQSDGQEVTLVENFQVRFPFHYFETSNNGFSWINSYLLSASSMAVYYDGNNFQNDMLERFNKMGLSVDYSDDTNPYGVDLVIAYNDEIVLVAIRGTQMSEDWQDVAIDGAHPIIPAPPAWGLFGVHAGFFIASASVFDLVADRVSNLLTGNRKLWITGHSLGGAMSSLIAYRLQVINNINVEGVHTFGSPRVGNYYWMWANSLTGLADKTWRWAAQGDTVTTLPFFDLKFYLYPKPVPRLIYAHVGHTNTLFADSSVEIDGPEHIFIQTDPLDFFNGLFDEHMSYMPRIYSELATHLDSDIYGIMPRP